MAESKNNAARWATALAVPAVVAVGAWLLLGESSDRRGPGAADPAPTARTAPPQVPNALNPGPAASELRIASGGRLSLDTAEIPDDGPLILALDLPDEARGSGDRTVRIVSEHGRRIDATASPLPDAGSGVRLEIDAGFLAPGRYLIEVDTVENHPLQIRRYVLELK